MSNWNKKKWGDAFKEAHKTVVAKHKTKIKNIIEGIKATPSAIKKTLKKK
jgi:molecular chaperone GrpE (heat shock protein)